jgi:ATP-dependent exoDNAse (exonuclease V) beta subunit
MLIQEIKNQQQGLGKSKTIDENQKKIAILVRENKQVEEIRMLCSKHKIYVETDIGGDLYKIRPTVDMYKLVLALQHNKDPKYLYNLYTTSYISNPMPKLEIYKNRRDKESLRLYFNSNKPIANWDTYIMNLRKEPVLKVLREIMLDVEPWKNYGVEVEIAKERKRRRIYYKRNLDEIFEKMLEVADTDYLTINKVQKFLEIMILTKRSEESREYYTSYEGSESNIVCMTVHKSKGLEYENVIMPYCNTDLSYTKKRGPVDIIVKNSTIGYSLLLDEAFTGKKYIRIENDNYEDQKKNEVKYRLNEETRILYVAMTRAIKKFTYFKEKDLRIKATWQNLVEGVKI